MFLLALASIGSYVLVHVEARYVAFAIVLLFTLYAASSSCTERLGGDQSLHDAVLLLGSMLLVVGVQDSFRVWKQADEAGAHPLRGIYNAATASAAAALGIKYAPGSEVGCLGNGACWHDTYWARIAGVKMTTFIETGRGEAVRDLQVDAEQGCRKLAQNPALLDLLRRRSIRAIVARFDSGRPCSAEWLPLEKSQQYYFLPP